MLLGVFFLPIQLCAPGSSVLLFFRGSERETQSDTAYQFFKQHPQTGVSGLGVSACRKSLFAPLNKFSELYKSSENLGFQWRRTPFLGFPRTPFLTVAENLPLYRQSPYIASAQKSAAPAGCDPIFLHIRTSDPAGAGRSIFRVFILFARNWKTSRSFFCCNFYKR